MTRLSPLASSLLLVAIIYRGGADHGIFRTPWTAELSGHLVIRTTVRRERGCEGGRRGSDGRREERETKREIEGGREGRKRKTEGGRNGGKEREDEGRSEGGKGERHHLSLFPSGSSTVYRILQNVSWKSLTARQERRHFRCTRTLLVIVS